MSCSLQFRFTSWQAFRKVLNEISDLAGQREVVAESLQLQIIQGITLLSKTLREERKVSIICIDRIFKINNLVIFLILFSFHFCVIEMPVEWHIFTTKPHHTVGFIGAGQT